MDRLWPVAGQFVAFWGAYDAKTPEEFEEEVGNELRKRERWDEPTQIRVEISERRNWGRDYSRALVVSMWTGNDGKDIVYPLSSLPEEDARQVRSLVEDEINRCIQARSLPTVEALFTRVKKELRAGRHGVKVSTEVTHEERYFAQPCPETFSVYIIRNGDNTRVFYPVEAISPVEVQTINDGIRGIARRAGISFEYRG